MNDIDLNGMKYLSGLMGSFGFELDPMKKNIMASSRIRSMCRKYQLNFGEVASYINRENLPSLELKRWVVESLLTHETYFFREEIHLKIMVEEIKRTFSANEPIKIISMGCSSGQEMYSIAMYIKHFIPQYFDNISIYGTDISKPIMLEAQRGVYDSHDISRSVNKELLSKYITQVSPDWYEINHEIKSKIKKIYKQYLVTYNSDEKFDFIFCKNVLIYFDNVSKQLVMNNIIEKSMKRGTKLFLGLCENTQDTRLEKKKYISSIYYSKM